jgi:hypothetical protein
VVAALVRKPLTFVCGALPLYFLSQIRLLISIKNFENKCGTREDGSSLASQETLHHLWNPKFYHRVHKNLPQELFKINVNTILPPTPTYPRWFPFFTFSYHHFVRFPHLSHACYISRPYLHVHINYLNK